MKKLMIAAAAAAMIGGAYAACSECTEDCDENCVAYDLKFSLKSLTPKALNCKDVCGEKSKVYYLDQTTRSLKGYLWACQYNCEDQSAMNIVLWDTKNKIAVIPYCSDNVAQIEAAFASFMVYGKKANKVAVGKLNVLWDGAIDVVAAAVGGSVGTYTTSCGTCQAYVKSASGYAAGNIGVIIPTTSTTTISEGSAGGLCDECTEVICEEEVEDVEILTLTLCDVCCFSSWCEDGVAVEDNMVPAVGSWSMKYNKKMSKGDKTLVQYLPSYAIDCGE